MIRRDLICAAGLCVLALAGCSRADKPTGKKEGGAPAPVLVARAVVTNMPVQLSAIGNVMANSKVIIRSQVTGQLQATHFQDGQEVRQGDLLFAIDPRPTQAALDVARANLARDTAQMDNLKIQFGREEKLVAAKIASQDEYETAKAALETIAGTVAADNAAVSNGLLNLEFTQIRAPVDGVVGAQQVYPGNIIKAPDDEMVVLNQIHPIQVVFTVPEQNLTAIKKEMAGRKLPVNVTFSGMKGAAPAGELTFVDNTVDTATGTIQLRATFKNEESKLWPGQFVQVLLTLSEITDAVNVPSQAVQTGQNGEYVFIVKSDQTVEMRPVKTGETHADLTVITKGVEAGETVVIDGQLRLVPGSKVNIKAGLSAESTNVPAGATP